MDFRMYKYLVSTTFTLFIVFALGLGIASIWPKAKPLSIHPDYTGYYWGNDGLIGRHYYRVRMTTAYGHWETKIDGVGFNQYRGYYPDGTLSEEGEIYVEFHNSPPEPYPNTSVIKWGNYYRPDGSLGSQIRDGTGEQWLWYPNGNPCGRTVFKDYNMVFYEMWSEDGKTHKTGTK